MPGFNGTVMVVEDDALIGLELRSLLEQAHYDVVGPCPSAKAALRIAAERPPDLVLMDVRLAGAADGVRAAGEIWTRYSIPSLFVTGHPELLERQRTAVASAVGVVEKPFSDTALLQAVKTGLAAAKWRRHRASISG